MMVFCWADHLSFMTQQCFLWVMCIFCCSWGLNVVGPLAGGVNSSVWLIIQWTSITVHEMLCGCCTWEEVLPSRSGAFQNIPLGVPYVWKVSLIFSVVWSPPLLMLVLGLLGWCSDTGHCQTLCITGLEMPVCSYHSVHYLCLHLLDLSVHGRGQSM